MPKYQSDIIYHRIKAQEAAHFICVPQIEQSELMMGKRRRERDKRSFCEEEFTTGCESDGEKICHMTIHYAVTAPFLCCKKRVGKDVNLAASQHLF